jgi:hypothetical protein
VFNIIIKHIVVYIEVEVVSCPRNRFHFFTKCILGYIEGESGFMPQEYECLFNSFAVELLKEYSVINIALFTYCFISPSRTPLVYV